MQKSFMSVNFRRSVEIFGRPKRRFSWLLICVLGAALALHFFAPPAVAGRPTTGDRIAEISEKFLGVPYMTNPLGEGPRGEFARNPRLRYDGFDCTTFIETMIALAKAPRERDILPWLDTIRYEDRPTFESRNHFVGVDWIAHNSEIGIVRDITKSVAREGVEVAKAEINKRNWYAKLGADRLTGVPPEEQPELLEKLHRRGRWMWNETERVPYVHKSYIIEHPEVLERIPNGAVINIVRPNFDITEKAGTHLNVTHQGLAIRRDGVTYFRHAAVGKRVLDVPLIDYVTTVLVPSPTMQGINILKVN